MGKYLIPYLPIQVLLESLFDRVISVVDGTGSASALHFVNHEADDRQSIICRIKGGCDSRAVIGTHETSSIGSRTCERLIKLRRVEVRTLGRQMRVFGLADAS
jgi:hypothetical protein